MSEVWSWRSAPEAGYAVIGDPVTHSLSPAMHTAAFRESLLRDHYVAIQAPRGEVAAALEHLGTLGYKGVNVTIPHKEEALSFAAGADEFCVKVRACNTIRMVDRAGINTDGRGFLASLDELGVGSGSRVLVLGAGGSARALALALADAGYLLRIFNRTLANAEALVSSLGISAEIANSPNPDGAALVVNTTSASLAGDSLKVDWSRAEPGAIAYDLMYGSEPTPFLAEASASGLKAVDGKALLVAQGALSFEWWTGLKAPRQAMWEAIR
jgi:shikimate dehydrogenase